MTNIAVLYDSYNQAGSFDPPMQDIINNYCTPVHFGRVKYSLPRVDNHGIQWRGVCNNSFIIIHLHRISGGKNYDEEGKEMKKERKRGEKV